MMAVSKKATGGAAAVVALAALYAGDKVFIDADGGGSVMNYVQRYDDLYAKGDRVIVRGQCYSSCTMAIAYPNACLMPQAVLGFHPAYVPFLFGLLHYQVSPTATKIMRDHYPPDAQAVIDRHHGLDDKGGWLRPQITLIPATEFPHRYQCQT